MRDIQFEKAISECFDGSIYRVNRVNRVKCWLE